MIDFRKFRLVFRHGVLWESQSFFAIFLLCIQSEYSYLLKPSALLFENVFLSATEVGRAFSFRLVFSVGIRFAGDCCNCTRLWTLVLSCLVFLSVC